MSSGRTFMLITPIGLAPPSQEIRMELDGYKHAMVPIIASAIAQDRPIRILNAPLVADTEVLSEIVLRGGGKATLTGNVLQIDPRGLHMPVLDDRLTSLIHGASYLIPAYAARFGEVEIGPTGGCAIGNANDGGRRPVGHIIQALSAFGYEGQNDHGRVRVRRRLKPEKVEIDIDDFATGSGKRGGPLISGSTKTALIAATMHAETRILNPYKKTDVKELARFLRMCGHYVCVDDRIITVRSSAPKSKPSTTVEIRVASCVSEVMTYFSLAIMLGLPISIEVSEVSTVEDGLKNEIRILKRMGIGVSTGDSSIAIRPPERINPLDILVDNDSIQSDHLPFFALLMTKATGSSYLADRVWESRYAYISALNKMGADIDLVNDGIKVNPSVFRGSNQVLKMADTRSAAVVALAAICSRKSAILEETQHLDRGYSKIDDNLSKFGVNIGRFFDATNV